MVILSDEKAIEFQLNQIQAWGIVYIHHTSVLLLFDSMNTCYILRTVNSYNFSQMLNIIKEKPKEKLCGLLEALVFSYDWPDLCQYHVEKIIIFT